MKDLLLAKRNKYQEERNKALEYATYCKIKLDVLDDIINELEQEEAQPVEEMQPVETTPII